MTLGISVIHESAPMRLSHFAAISLFFLFYAAILTGYIQEDAFIYFRTASNIAYHGDYSFNLGENYPAATSTLYAYLIALHMLVFRDFFALTVQMMNVGAAVLGAALLASAVPGRGLEHRPFSPFIFWLVAISPPLVTLATSGMETALVFLALAAQIHGLHGRKATLLVFSSFLLPFLRIEATVAPVLVAVLAALSGDRKIVAWTVGSAVAGVLACFLLNFWLIGEAVPQTITAKNAAYQPLHTVSAILARMGPTFFEKSYFLGITTKFIPGAIHILIGIAAVAGSAVLVSRYGRAILRKERDALPARTTEALVVGLIFAFPMGYIIGGVIFPWYLWPSSVLAYFLFAMVVERAAAKHSFAIPGATALVTALSLFNLLLLTNYGAQEAGFRADVGRFIAAQADEADTLFLEPAGYIPYYAGLKTWDTVGLVSPDILAYLKPGNSRWWIEFIRDKQPTYVVERSALHKGALPEGITEDGFTPVDREEWVATYELVRSFVYAEYLHAHRSILTPLHRRGGHSDYYVYRRKKEVVIRADGITSAI